MAKLYIKQAKLYAEARPTYPFELFQFIASKTPCHDLVWDVGTGSGQAIPQLAKMFKNVLATDTSAKQLDFAPKIPNVKYYQTPPTISIEELEQNVASQSSVDLVTIAQAIHWFDLPNFYNQVKHVLKKPNGVIAAWCYSTPKVDDKVDTVFETFHRVDSYPYWTNGREVLDKHYIDLNFPFEAVDGVENTGPLEFKSIEKVMCLDEYIAYIKSTSAYNTAKEKGVELFTDELLRKFKVAWNSEDCGGEKVVKFHIYLRIGKVGDLDYK